jgi:MarR family transcriptional regulator, transcriptional regulator for hemolysin
MAANTVRRTIPDISYLLAHASHVLATRMTEALQEIGLTPRGFCVLMHALPGELTQIELARVADLDKTTMVVTLDELEETGYAERVPSPADRRARLVRVTGRGREITEAGLEIVDRVHQEVLDSLPPSQRDAFLAAMTTLVDGYLAEPVDCDRPVRRPRRQS